MNKTTRFLFALWLIASGSIGSPTPCFANTSVTLNPEVETKKFAVRLSDLFAGVPTDIDRDIAQAPPPCKPAVYNEAVLNKLAETYRLDWQAQGAADHVVVTSACTRISNDMIRDAVVENVKVNSNTKGRAIEAALDERNLEVDLPADQQPNFRLENFAYDPTNKHFRADLTADTPRGRYIVPVTGHVTIKRNVPVLAHRLEGHTAITEADLDWLQVPDERISDDVITEQSQLIGRELRRDVGEGELLRGHDVVPPRLVQRGSLVTMRIKTPFITITAQGKADQDGAEGDVIRVVNTQSNRVVEGTVSGAGTVEIHTAREVAWAE
jgi:flagella basal body P-ring formation protein FlgA